jgi:alpha,alpha-trehalose phosphorylase
MHCVGAEKADLSFRPQLPPGIIGLSFRLRYQGRVLMASIREHQASYSLVSGEPMAILHYGESVTVGDSPVTLDIPVLSPLPSPSQPAGREPQSRRART